MKKILFISSFSLGSKVRHAGGKNAHNIINSIKDNKNYNLEILMLYNSDEKDFLNDDYVGVKVSMIETKSSFLWNVYDWLPIRRDVGLMSTINKRQIKKYMKNNNNFYDIIWLHWSEAASLYPYFKKKYPSAKFVLFEEDVKFLNLARIYETENNIIKKIFRKIRLCKEKKFELNVCNKVDCIICVNEKDLNLLTNERIKSEKIYTMPPYFDRINAKMNELDKNSIIFYGAMGRKENEQAVLWFIDNVFNDLNKNIKLNIVGANPTEKLKKIVNPRITVTGFVESPDYYFNQSFCMVCPLFLGAGIKIKTIQGLSSGIPVVSTDVGIEGINAINGIHYVLANEASEFIEKINYLYENPEEAKKIGFEGKKFIDQHFDYDMSLKHIINFLNNL